MTVTARRLSADAWGLLAAVSGVVILLVAMTLWVYFQQWQRYEDELDRLSPRIARLQGELSAQEELAGVLGSAQALMIRYAYPVQGGQPMGESEFQSRMRTIIQSSGIEISGTQQLPPKLGDGFDEISIMITCNSTLEQLYQVLSTLNLETPHIRIEKLTLRPVYVNPRAPDSGKQVLTTQLQLTAVRLKGEGG